MSQECENEKEFDFTLLELLIIGVLGTYFRFEDAVVPHPANRMPYGIAIMFTVMICAGLIGTTYVK